MLTHSQMNVQRDEGNGIRKFILCGINGPLLRFFRFFPPQKTHFLNISVSTLKDTCFGQERGELHHKYQEKALSSCSVYLRSEVHQCKHI